MSACSYYRQSRAEKGGEEVVFQHKSSNEIEKKKSLLQTGFAVSMRVPWPCLRQKFCMKACLLSGPVLNTPSENIHPSVYFQ